jgi:hypothetical protein
MGAIKFVVAEKKLEGGIPKSFDLRGIQVNNHAVADWLSAGGNRSAFTFDFYETETTGSKRRDCFSCSAQVRYIKPIIQG